MTEVVRQTIKAVDSGTIPTLGVTFPNHPISKPGIFLSYKDAASTPTLSFVTPSSTGKYLAVCIDLDAPFPSWPVLPAAHWIQPDLLTFPSGELVIEEGKKAVASYAGPRPPPISDPHQYVFLLYEQPKDVVVQSDKLGFPEDLGIRHRMKWNQESFERKVGLGKVVAGNWFASK